MQQENIQKTHSPFVDTDIDKRVQIHQPHLDILHPTLAQGMQGTFATPDHTFGTDGAVELVFNLQQSGGKLVVIAPWIANANRLIRRIGNRQGFMQRGGIPIQAVVAHGQRRLGIALIAQPSHAQGRGMRQIHGSCAQWLQSMRTPLYKTAAHHGRSPKQIQQQEGVAPEIADQTEILLA